MSESIFSPYWYRVAELKPRLPAHVQLHRHRYRGEDWTVLQDRAGGRHHRLSPAAHWVCGLMDGERTVQEIWDTVTDRFGDDAPTQDETIQLLGRLHAANALLCDVNPDGLEVLQRFEDDRRTRWRQRFGNPFALRFPLVDPDRWLEAALPLVRPLFSVAGGLIWLAVVGTAAVLAGSHWRELSENVADRVLSAQNLLYLAFTFPVVKLLHECGHAFATKVRGGEVHEAGIILLVLMPVPYVDASAASSFRGKQHRVLVGAGGMAVELFIAALALFAWLLVEPGWVRTAAWNVMLIGGVSTLAFNANPLLRFDGYYILADAIDIPNLGSRANAYLGFWIQSRLFGLRDLRSPATGKGEARWFASYGIAAFVYRIFIVFAIALFIAEKFLFVGAVLAIVGVVTQVAMPIAKHVNFVLTSPRLARQRVRAVSISAGLATAILLFLFAFPLPLRTRAEGVVWLPEHSQLRAGADGFVDRLLTEPGEEVVTGQTLVASHDPLLEAEVALLEGYVAEFEARHDAAWRSERVETEILTERLATARAELAHARERAADTALRSPGNGRFLVPSAQDLPGRFLRQGELVGWVSDFSTVTARVVVPQSDIALVRRDTRSVSVRLAERPGEVIPARIERQVPSASQRLPSAALGSRGGGRLAVDPSDEDGMTALETVFQFDLVLDTDTPLHSLGGRVHVLFDHGTEPVAHRSFRALRRLLLSRIGV